MPKTRITTPPHPGTRLAPSASQLLRRVAIAFLAALALPAASVAQTIAPAAATGSALHEATSTEALPPAVAAALARAQVDAGAMAMWVQPVDGGPPLVQWNAAQPMNPASVFKLTTTAAALDLLGPAWTWKTTVGFTGPVDRGVLRGSLVIRGGGDPSLVLERVWLLLRHVRALGVRQINGDIVLDHGAFAPAARSPGDFDGEPREPYNVQPDALLLNFKSVTLSFVPDPKRGVARVIAEPPLAGVVPDASVRLAGGPCGDWRAGLHLAASDPARWHFAGAYPASCGERAWPVAYSDPVAYGTRMIAALWRESGGILKGSVRDGAAPAGFEPAFEFASPSLAEVVRDINKFSNNVMAEQVWLTLGLQRRRASPDPAASAAPATPEDAHAALAQWLHERLGATADDVVIINGSGLARETRISARTLAHLLQWVWRSPVMPELASSLPVVGIDGTLRRSTATPGRAHLKTGSIRDVGAVAGYVLGEDGRRYVLVALVNDARAGAAHAALDAAIQWTEELGAARTPMATSPQASQPAGSSSARMDQKR